MVQNWHKPYDQALLEADPVRRPETIAVAERAILKRYLQPLSQVPPDEDLDLKNAIAALSCLKKSNTAA